MKIVHDGSLVEMCQLGHVVGFVELCGIDFIHVVLMEHALLQKTA